MKTVKIITYNDFFSKTYAQIVNGLSNPLKNQLLNNPFNFKTFNDLDKCISLTCGKCEACSFGLFLAKKYELKNRNKDTWTQAKEVNRKAFFKKEKLFHSHLIDFEKYSLPNNPYNEFNNEIKTPIYEQFDGMHVSNKYVLYKEVANNGSYAEYEILFICRHPDSTEKSWDTFYKLLKELI